MTQPTTWEEATQDVAVSLAAFSGGEDWTLDEVLAQVEGTLDSLRAGTEYEEALFRCLAWLGAVGYVLEKWPDKGGARGNYPGFVEGGCNSVVRDVLVLLPKKQHDYGPDNILWGGVQGVVVRAHDKLARIKNLRARQSVQVASALGVTAYNEPLADSYFDLIGYGIVGAMLVKGTFQLPLADDLAEAYYAGQWLADAEEKHPGPFFSEQQQGEIREIAKQVVLEETHRPIGIFNWPLSTEPAGDTW